MADVGRRTRKGFPYLIVNASVDRGQATDWLDGLYEFTGIGTRGAGRDEVAWGRGDDAFPYQRAVTISGAAFAPFLKQRIPEPLVAGSTATVTLDDGGATENLGAIALIRRGVPNIVIIDAEHDPRYGFGAYVNLKNRLPRWGANIVIPEIEAHLASGRQDSPASSYFRGTVTGSRANGSIYSLQIHYIKMSYGKLLRDRLNSRWAASADGPMSWQDLMMDPGRDVPLLQIANSIWLNFPAMPSSITASGGTGNGAPDTSTTRWRSTFRNIRQSIKVCMSTRRPRLSG